MCADLGSRRIRDEIDAMEVLGIDTVHRLIMPRIFAAAMVAILLDAIVSIAGIAGGWFFAIVVQHGTTSSYFGSFNELSQLADLFMALIKAVVFGYVAGTVACYKGFFVKGGPKGVGEAVNQAVVITFIFLFFLNFIFTALYFNFVPQKL
jgi:phospholipid/cholesterol/gamma-HCH transport system permease protein